MIFDQNDRNPTHCPPLKDRPVRHLKPDTVAVSKQMNMVLMTNNDHMIPRNEFGLIFLAFVLRLRENPGKTSSRKLTRLEIEPGRLREK